MKINFLQQFFPEAFPFLFGKRNWSGNISITNMVSLRSLPLMQPHPLHDWSSEAAGKLN